MVQRLWYILKCYLLTVVIFVIAKVVFMLSYSGTHDFSLADVAQVVYHGMSLDLSTALYFIVIPWLLALVSFWCPVKAIIIKCYYLLIALAFALAFTADTSLYAFWGFKLDATCLDYLLTPTEAMASVSTGYLLLRLLIVIVTTIVITLLYGRYCRFPKGGRLIRPWRSILLFVVSIPIIVIGIRGGLGESTTNIGQVYFSQKQFLNHAAVNPVFSFLSSFEKTASYIPDYHFMDDQERAALMEGIYPTVSIQPDSLLTTQRPDVIIVLMESCGGIFTEDIGGRKDIMPRFNKLVKEGVYFSRFYANSYRTDRGTVCTLSGYPSFPKSSVMKMPAKTRFLPGIAKSLRNVGYMTSYLYGGDINFTNMRSYLITTGFEQLYWQKNFTEKEQQSAQWGVRDDITFEKLLQQVQAFKPQQHYLIGYSTLSSHEPWDVPTHRLEEEIPNAFNYLDECIGNFIDKAKRLPQWDNLLVIFLPDHGYSYFDVGEEHEMHDHVPMLWLGGAVKQPRRVEKICNQTDLAATLLGQMGIRHDDFTFSRDVMSRNYTYPFAIHTYNNGITMQDSTGFAVMDLNSERIVVNQATDAQQLIRRGMAILQTASQHVNNLK